MIKRAMVLSFLLAAAPAGARAAGCTAATNEAKGARIAAHAWGNHGAEFVKDKQIAGKKYPGPTLQTQAGLAGKVRTILDGVAGVAIADGRRKYWDAATGTIVIFNSRTPDCGTVFRPDRGKNYYDAH
jgi:hypothetical protein